MFECNKCGHSFEVPDTVNHKFNDGHYASIKRCPLCKHSHITETKQKGESVEG